MTKLYIRGPSPVELLVLRSLGIQRRSLCANSWRYRASRLRTRIEAKILLLTT